MKTLLKTIILIFTFILNGQTEISKPGIYKSFYEFKTNNPSVEFAGEIKSQAFNLGNKTYFTEYLLKITKEESKKIGNVFGFSDGTNFYIGTELHNIYDFSFYKLEFIGKKILYFESLKSGKYGLVKDKNILTMDSGEIKYMTNSRMKKLLKDKPTLYKKFKAQSNKYDYIKEYIIEYQKE